MSPPVNIYSVTHEDGSTSMVRDDFNAASSRIPIKGAGTPMSDVVMDQLAKQSADLMKQSLSGGSVSYYSVIVDKPCNTDIAYIAECGDIIDALQLTFSEGCILKEIWRTANARLGNGKPGNTEKRAAEKIAYYANRMLDKVSK